MSDVEQIESAILRLPPQDFRRLTDWIAELHQRRWDEQLERDVAAGRLENLAAEALPDYQAGRTPRAAGLHPGAIQPAAEFDGPLPDDF
jgi:hypothetical protein